MRKRILFLLTALSMIFIFSGCAKSVQYDAVKDYADPIVNSMLTSINNLDYNAFSSYLSDDMKNSLSLAEFQKETAEILSNAGTFKSATFYAGEDKNGYVSLIYDVSFSNLTDTTPISITFKKDDNEHKVEQFYFDSSLINNN
ncbi:MAG: DUF3887 domain-containing protein [Clostridium sp.]|uniref:DUF3887 domain-containing protein n=1 Tax=Clostridium sp. DSM 8431 TaxID=1761781 RepID=UPI0008EA2468|nr:DUF3887 domain-containing protein [Clostridium sp. DSM 8431]MCR4943737.1 DUF3887 domain-containing protein [Clostridium sp.]SFU36251.1 Protein of unknown function [Clostridium sp. DSM 8431]